MSHLSEQLREKIKQQNVDFERLVEARSNLQQVILQQKYGFLKDIPLCTSCTRPTTTSPVCVR